VDPNYPEMRDSIRELLQREASLQEMVQLVGPDALQDQERLIIEVGRILREDFLQQNGFHEIDAYCSMKKAHGMMRMVTTLYQAAEKALKEGVPIDQIIQNPVVQKIARARYTPEKDFQTYLGGVLSEINAAFKKAA